MFHIPNLYQYCFLLILHSNSCLLLNTDLQSIVYSISLPLTYCFLQKTHFFPLILVDNFYVFFMTDSGFNTPRKALVIFQFSSMYISFSNISSPCIVMVFFLGHIPGCVHLGRKAESFFSGQCLYHCSCYINGLGSLPCVDGGSALGSSALGMGRYIKKVGAPCYRYVVGLAAFSPPRKQITKRDPIFL